MHAIKALTPKRGQDPNIIRNRKSREYNFRVQFPLKYSTAVKKGNPMNTCTDIKVPTGV